jgi:hypothetical protein
VVARTRGYRNDGGGDGEGGRKFSLGIQEVSGGQLIILRFDDELRVDEESGIDGELRFDNEFAVDDELGINDELGDDDEFACVKPIYCDWCAFGPFIVW